MSECVRSQSCLNPIEKLLDARPELNEHIFYEIIKIYSNVGQFLRSLFDVLSCCAWALLRRSAVVAALTVNKGGVIKGG